MKVELFAIVALPYQCQVTRDLDMTVLVSKSRYSSSCLRYRSSQAEASFVLTFLIACSVASLRDKIFDASEPLELVF